MPSQWPLQRSAQGRPLPCIAELLAQKALCRIAVECIGRSPLTLHLIQGDITTLPVSAVVNAANEGMLGGAGVDGAIHRAAGPRLRDECAAFPVKGGVRCPTGEARLTKGYALLAGFVIHTVGPNMWSASFTGKQEVADAALRRCYLNSLMVTRAVSDHVHSIAFPCISTGVYGFPKERAAAIAVKVVVETAPQFPWIQHVVFCVFSEEDARLYLPLLTSHSVV